MYSAASSASPGRNQPGLWVHALTHAAHLQAIVSAFAPFTSTLQWKGQGIADIEPALAGVLLQAVLPTLPIQHHHGAGVVGLADQRLLINSANRSHGHDHRVLFRNGPAVGVPMLSLPYTLLRRRSRESGSRGMGIR